MVAAAVLTALATADVGFGDAGEIGAAAWLRRAPEAAGTALDVCILQAASLVPIGSIAFRQNLVTAILAALTLAAVADLAFVLVRRAGGEARPGAVGAVLAAAALGTATPFLDVAVALDTHASALAVVALGWRLALGPGPALAGASLAFGLSLGAHPIASLALLPALFVARGRPLGPALVAALAGAGILAFAALVPGAGTALVARWIELLDGAAWRAHVVLAVAAAAVAGGFALGMLASVAWARTLPRVLVVLASAALGAALVRAAPREALSVGHAADELLGAGGTLAQLPPRTTYLCGTVPPARPGDTRDDGCAAARFALGVDRARPDLELRRVASVAPDELLALATVDRAPRPVVFDDDAALRAADAPVAIIGAPMPPFLTTSTAGLPPARDPVSRLDRMREARLGRRTPAGPVRVAWARAFLTTGKGALGAGQSERAIRAFARAVRLDPERGAAWTYLASALARAGETTRAQALIEEARAAGVRDARLESAVR